MAQQAHRRAAKRLPTTGKSEAKVWQKSGKGLTKVWQKNWQKKDWQRMDKGWRGAGEKAGKSPAERLADWQIRRQKAGKQSDKRLAKALAKTSDGVRKRWRYSVRTWFQYNARRLAPGSADACGQEGRQNPDRTVLLVA